MHILDALQYIIYMASMFKTFIYLYNIEVVGAGLPKMKSELFETN